MHRIFMENKRETKGPKFKTYHGVGSPINLTNSRRSRSSFDPYASDSSDSPSPLMKFIRSADPENSGASSPPFVTPVKVEEEVIVMDGISMPKSNKGSSEVRVRLPLMSSNSVNCSFGISNPTVSSSVSGSSSRCSVVENSKFFKNRLCHYWEASGICQFGSECQFAHGKEELCYHRSSGKNQLEISKPNSSSEGSIPSWSLSPSPYGPTFPRHNQIQAASSPAEEETLSLPSLPLNIGSPASPIPPKQLSGLSSMPDNSLFPSDWTPQVDGIEASLPSGSTVEKGPSKEDVDAYIENVLYGTEVKKRLPAFAEIFHHS